MGNCLLNAGLTLLCLLPMLHRCIFFFFTVFFPPYSGRSDNLLSRTWGHAGVSRCQGKERERGKTSPGKEKRRVRNGGGGRGWWKIKPMPAWLPLAREVSLCFASEASEDSGKDKGWAKEMLCLSLHWLLIYLCPIPGNPRSGRLEAKAFKPGSLSKADSLP